MLMKKLICTLIKGYQNISHLLFPHSCRFYPSCSQYALESIEQKGVLKGALSAGLRIVRCSPFSKGGYDPVN